MLPKKYMQREKEKKEENGKAKLFRDLNLCSGKSAAYISLNPEIYMLHYSPYRMFMFSSTT